MTPSAPTWAEIERFLKIDGWRELPQHGAGKSDTHRFFEKLLGGGELLQTHTSHASSKRPSPGTFATILRIQLKISKTEFWAALASGQPVDRPVPEVEPRGADHEGTTLARSGRCGSH